MGQGTDSCGGYDFDCDPYSEGLDYKIWTQRDGTKIRVRDMSVGHLHGAKAIAQRAAQCSNFTSDRDTFKEWVAIFDNELFYRNETDADIQEPDIKPLKPTRGEKVTMICHCGCEYEARTADVKRGWGLSCSKGCAAIRRNFNKPAAKPKK